jgi:nicotinamide-nucleotide adenylyltransferase
LACIKEEDLKFLHSGQISKIIFPMERDIAHKKKISHLIVRLFIISISPKNEVLYLVQKRSKNKESYPNYFTDSASGHITWTLNLNLTKIKQNAIRELQEEFGIPPNKIIKLKFYELSPLDEYLTKEISYTFFGLIEYNIKLKPDPFELDTKASRFYTETELKNLLENEQAIDYSRRIWERMLNMDLISFFKDSSNLSKNNKGEVALFIGRFQPLHHGHIYVIKKILKSYSLIKIGIGSSQESHKTYNPFTSEERKKFIVEALKKRNISSDQYKIYNIPDIFNAKEWVDHVVSIVGEFNVIFSNSDWVRTLFKSNGYKVGQKLTIFTKKFNGSNIRSLINQEKEEWKRLIPNEVIKLMNSFNGIERIKSLDEKSESA